MNRSEGGDHIELLIKTPDAEQFRHKHFLDMTTLVAVADGR